MPLKKNYPKERRKKTPPIVLSDGSDYDSQEDEEENHNVFYDKGLYALTINPRNDYQYFGNPRRKFLMKQKINDVLGEFKEAGIHYRMYWELSEPKDNVVSISGPRLHLHGFIRFTTEASVKQFLMYHLYFITRIGMYKVEPLTCSRGWLKYCNKQSHIMKIDPLSNVDSLKDILNSEGEHDSAA